MKCPVCGCNKSSVIDTRPSDLGSIRRRRYCESCKYRFTTYEMTIESLIDNNNKIRDKIKEQLLSTIDKATERPIMEYEKHHHFLPDVETNDFQNVSKEESEHIVTHRNPKKRIPY